MQEMNLQFNSALALGCFQNFVIVKAAYFTFSRFQYLRVCQDLSVYRRGESQSRPRFRSLQVAALEVCKYVQYCGTISLGPTGSQNQIIQACPLEKRLQYLACQMGAQVFSWEIPASWNEAEKDHKPGVQQPASLENPQQASRCMPNHVCLPFRPKLQDKQIGFFHSRNGGVFQSAVCAVLWGLLPPRSISTFFIVQWDLGVQVPLVTRVK